jgi:hypothetical protein
MPAGGAPLMAYSSRYRPITRIGCERFSTILKLANFINLVYDVTQIPTQWVLACGGNFAVAQLVYFEKA